LVASLLAALHGGCGSSSAPSQADVTGESNGRESVWPDGGGPLPDGGGPSIDASVACDGSSPESDCNRCQPHEMTERACGACMAGKQTRTCVDGEWSDWSACIGEECAPGETEQIPCGNCNSGMQTATCDSATCQWSGTGACMGSSGCDPSQPPIPITNICTIPGDCHTYNKVCTADCKLVDGPCTATCGDPCAKVTLGPGSYFCGNSDQYDFAGNSNADYLYVCGGGKTTSRINCGTRCCVEPMGTPDKCPDPGCGLGSPVNPNPPPTDPCNPNPCNSATQNCSSGHCSCKIACGSSCCAAGQVCCGSVCRAACGGCFVAGTPVTMADGSSKPIETIRGGDAVLAFDLASGRTVAEPVEELIVHHDHPALVVVNGTLTTTPEHRFYADGAWMRADQLRVGALLVTMGAGLDHPVAEPVESLSEMDGGTTVYNLEVGEQHNYFAGGVLVHNLKIP
jgi:hypothetical protein